MDANVSERVWTYRSHASMLDDEQRQGPRTTVARHTRRLLFSLHERRTSQGHLHDRFFSHPPATCSVMFVLLSSPCKCRVHLASGVSCGTARCSAGTQIKGRSRRRRAELDAHCRPLPWVTSDKGGGKCFCLCLSVC